MPLKGRVQAKGHIKRLPDAFLYALFIRLAQLFSLYAQFFDRKVPF